MSDKYYLHDCNSYTHSCQNTYRIECKDSLKKVEAEKETQTTQKALSWWQRLRKQEKQEARA